MNRFGGVRWDSNVGESVERFVDFNSCCLQTSRVAEVWGNGGPTLFSLRPVPISESWRGEKK